jgi:hypothetical protein
MARAIFMFMHGDLAVGQSPEEAAGGMEAVDVETGVYEVVYDDTGLVYEPIVVEKYQVRLVPTQRRDYDDLVGRLINFGLRAGLELNEEATVFPLAAARSVAEWERERRWPKRPRWLHRRIHGSQPPQF